MERIVHSRDIYFLLVRLTSSSFFGYCNTSGQVIQQLQKLPSDVITWIRSDPVQLHLLPSLVEGCSSSLVILDLSPDIPLNDAMKISRPPKLTSRSQVPTAVSASERGCFGSSCGAHCEMHHSCHYYHCTLLCRHLG